MPRQWLQFLTPLTAAAFLLVNTPLGSLLGTTKAAYERTQKAETRSPAKCSCCHSHDAEGEGGSEELTRNTEDSCPRPQPCHPYSPCCPDGCSWCCVAKVPCFISSVATPTLQMLSLDQSLTEPSLHFPPPFCAGLIRPPRV